MQQINANILIEVAEGSFTCTALIIAYWTLSNSNSCNWIDRNFLIWCHFHSFFLIHLGNFSNLSQKMTKMNSIVLSVLVNLKVRQHQSVKFPIKMRIYLHNAIHIYQITLYWLFNASIVAYFVAQYSILRIVQFACTWCRAFAPLSNRSGLFFHWNAKVQMNSLLYHSC